MKILHTNSTGRKTRFLLGMISTLFFCFCLCDQGISSESHQEKTIPYYLNKNFSEDLCRAVTLKQYDKAASLLNQGADPNEACENRHLIHVAMDNGTADIVSLLFKHGARLNDLPGTLTPFYPLHRACDENRPELVKLLLEHGADINHRDKSGYTPLMKAVSKQSGDIVDYLIEKGANVNAVGERGFSALSIAAGNASLDIVKVLLAHGANLTETKDPYIAPVTEAAQRNKMDNLKCLVEAGAPVNTGSDWMTPLMYAIQNKNLEMSRYLLKHGANPNTQSPAIRFDIPGRTPLSIAVNRNHTDIVEILLDAGVDPNPSIDRGYSPLLTAYIDHMYGVIHLLRDKGVRLTPDEQKILDDHLNQSWSDGETREQCETLFLDKTSQHKLSFCFRDEKGRVGETKRIYSMTLDDKTIQQRLPIDPGEFIDTLNVHISKLYGSYFLVMLPVFQGHPSWITGSRPLFFLGDLKKRRIEPLMALKGQPGYFDFRHAREGVLQGGHFYAWLPYSTDKPETTRTSQSVFCIGDAVEKKMIPVVMTEPLPDVFDNVLQVNKYAYTVTLRNLMYTKKGNFLTDLEWRPEIPLDFEVVKLTDPE